LYLIPYFNHDFFSFDVAASTQGDILHVM